MFRRGKDTSAAGSAGSHHLKEVHAPDGAMLPGKLPIARQSWWADPQALRKAAEGAVFVMLVLIIGFYGSAVFFRSTEAARRKSCRDNLHNIGMALQMYAQDHDSLGPPADCDFGRVMLKGGYLEARQTICPSDDLARFESRKRLRTGESRRIPISYTYHPPVMSAIDHVDNPSATPFLWDRNAGVPKSAHVQGGNVLYADGRVHWVPINYWTGYDNP